MGREVVEPKYEDGFKPAQPARYPDPYHYQERQATHLRKQETKTNINSVGLKHFPSIDKENSIARPNLFSNWLSKNYNPVERGKLREYTRARLKVFYEVELDGMLVLLNEKQDHGLRTDRTFRQPQGQLLLIGMSGGQGRGASEHVQGLGRGATE